MSQKEEPTQKKEESHDFFYETSEEPKVEESSFNEDTADHVVAEIEDANETLLNEASDRSSHSLPDTDIVHIEDLSDSGASCTSDDTEEIKGLLLDLITQVCLHEAQLATELLLTPDTDCPSKAETFLETKKQIHGDRDKSFLKLRKQMRRAVGIIQTLKM